MSYASIHRSVVARLDELVGTRTIEAVLMDYAGARGIDPQIYGLDIVIDGEWYRFTEGWSGWCSVARITNHDTTPAQPDKSWRIAPIVAEFCIRQTPTQRMLYATRESDGLVVFVAGTVNTQLPPEPSWGGPLRHRDTGQVVGIRHTRIVWEPNGFTPRWLHDATEGSA